VPLPGPEDVALNAAKPDESAMAHLLRRWHGQMGEGNERSVFANQI
jgi:hypothetical protein